MRDPMAELKMTAVLMRISAFLIAIATVQMVEGCGRNQIRCPSGNKCIEITWICDTGNDCGDLSDEAYCTNSAPISCSDDFFQCSRGTCIPRSSFCNNLNDCGDRSDEFYCNLERPTPCPRNWVRCNDSRRCIQANWKCDGIEDCLDGSDENECSNIHPSTMLRSKASDIVSARNRNINWLLNRRKRDSSTNRWGQHLNRISTALYLADEGFFAPGNKTGEEMGYELTIQLLYKLSGNDTMRSQELALYIQALMVTCTNPKDFFGHNLVSALRGSVNSNNYTNPFEILVLCTAGDAMTNKDVERVTTAFDSQHRPFWTDTQAIATMALQCLASSPNVKVDERMVKDMQQELKKRQFRNGTVDNLITTALVVQALLLNDSYKDYFDLGAALAVLLESQNEDGSWGSVRNSYNVLPVLNFKNIANISSKHCVKYPESEEETLKKLQDARGEKFVVQYSVWIGNDVDLGRTWRVRMKASGNCSFYDVIETVQKLDTRHNVKYNVIDDKPYVTSLYEREDDPELGVYWFTYLRSTLSKEPARLIEASPVDIMIHPNQELILWYKPERWT